MTTLLEMAVIGAENTLRIISEHCPNVDHLKISNPDVHYEDTQRLATKAAKDIDALFGVDVRRAAEAFINFGVLRLYSYEQEVIEIATHLRKEANHVQ